MAETIKVGMVSLGCPKNQCDAELMLAKIAKAGFKIVNEAGLADVVIINTCGFIQSAKEEAIEEIMEAISRKNDGINKKIIVTGCLAERYQKQMDEEFPEIDAVVGIAKNDDIVEIINSVMLDRRVVTFGDKLCHNMEGDKLQSTLPHYAYLRIADGCSNKCSYCAIPLIRGKMRSRKMENIIEEAKKFAENGVKELVIVAQDVTAYGIDLYKKYALPDLLKELCKIDGIKWIRLLYCYPERMTAERYQKQMDEEFPEIDAVVGIAKNDDIVEIINSVMLDRRVVTFGDKLCHNMEGDKLQSTLPHYAYLRIADGCSNKCSYCAIPLIRGKMRSRKMENIIEEAKKFAENGVKELVIVAQDVTAYGIDLYKKYALPDLLKELCKIDGIKWIRLLYCYPERMTDELIETIKTEDKVLNYIDIPIQHCNKEILRNMYRGGDEQSLRELFAKLRREIPGVVLRTTLITGFPGETEEQFSELAEFVNDIKFERLGCFAYSAEEDTPAAEMPDQVDEGERQRRADIITSEQEIRMGEYYAGMVGNTYEVVCEGFDRYSDMYFGRSMHFAPEIDGMIYFTSAKDKSSLTIGDFVNVKITDVLENNLLGERV